MTSMSAYPAVTLVSDYFWPFCRILALFSTAPILSDKSVNSRVRIGLALCISLLITPLLPDSGIRLFSLPGLMTLCRQLMLGMALGWGMTLVFAAIRQAGEVIGMQMGLSFASFYDQSSRSALPVLARILYSLALLLFLSIDGHLLLLRLLTETFISLPVGHEHHQMPFFSGLCELAGIIFSSALRLALPLILLLLTLNMTMGLLNRMSPQLSVFVIGFPLTLSLGILSCGWLFPWFISYSHQLMVRIIGQLTKLLLE